MVINSITGIAAIVILLVFNGFFVAAEFALVKAKLFRIDAVADQGSRAAKLTQRIQKNLESYLAACQLGNTMAALGLGWVGEPVVAALLEPVFALFGLPEKLIHSTAFVAGFLMFSSLHIVIGEQVPKTFAIRKAEPVSLWCAYPLHGFYLLVYPLNWLLNKAAASLLALFGVAELSHAEVLSDDEIQGIINTSEKHGELQTETAAMLSNMFKFNKHNVEQIMVPRSEVDILDLQIPWEENFQLILTTKHSRLPVFDGDPDNPVGILLAKDIYNGLVGGNKDQDPLLIMKAALREPYLVPESQLINRLFEDMRRNRTHIALVMDEYGCFSGVVTMEDMLEEIVGEIADELDVDEPDEYVRWVDDHWETDGLVALTDLDRFVEIDFPHDLDTNTINGLFMKNLGRMPQPNDEITAYELKFVAIDQHNNRIGRVHIYPAKSEAEHSETIPGLEGNGAADRS